MSFLFSTSGATVSFPSSSSSSVNKSSFSGSLAPLSPIIRFLSPLFSFLVFTSAIFCKCFSQNNAPLTFSFEQRHTPFVRVHLKASGTLSFDFFVTVCVRMEARCSSSLSKSSILLAFFAPEPRALSLLVKFVAAGVKLTSSRSNLSASASSGVTRTLESRCFEDNFFLRKATSAACMAKSRSSDSLSPSNVSSIPCKVLFSLLKAALFFSSPLSPPTRPLMCPFSFCCFLEW